MVPHKLHGLTVSCRVEKLLDGHADITNVFVAEATVTAELELEGEAVLPDCELVDGEFHREVPRRVLATFSVNVGFRL